MKRCTSDGIWLIGSPIGRRPFAMSVFKKQGFCLPDIQSAKLCIRLQLACHIRTCFRVQVSQDPGVMVSGRCESADWQTQTGSSACLCRTCGLATGLALQSPREISTASQKNTNKNKNKTAINIRIPPESQWMELTRATRLHWDRIKASSVCTHAQLRPIHLLFVMLPRIRAETGERLLHNISADCN